MTDEQREIRNLRRAVRLALKLITDVEKDNDGAFHTEDCSVRRIASDNGIDIRQLAVDDCDCGHSYVMSQIYKLKRKPKKVK